MQHSSQEPARQTDHAPSEIYQFEQKQENTQPPIFARGIAVYANRRKALWSMVFMSIRFTIAFIVMIFSLIQLFILSYNLPPNDDLTEIFRFLSVFLLILYLLLIAWSVWQIWRWYSTLLRNREPILVIDHRGIAVRSLPSLSGFFIAWHEIEYINVRSFLYYKCLCIRPRNEKQFLKRFNVFERFNRLNVSIFDMSPLFISQMYLDRPVEEIMQRLYYEYINELSYYRVQLLP